MTGPPDRVTQALENDMMMRQAREIADAIRIWFGMTELRNAATSNKFYFYGNGTSASALFRPEDWHRVIRAFRVELQGFIERRYKISITSIEYVVEESRLEVTFS